MISARLILVGAVFWFLGGATDCPAQRPENQAITYRNFGYIRAVTASTNYAYFATTGGIIRYHKIQRRWDQPLTGTQDMPTDPINRIWVDRFDQSLFVRTDFGLFEYDEFFNRWSQITELPPVGNDTRHIPAPDVFLPEFDALYKGGGEFTDFFGRQFETTDILQDVTGDVWVGTWGFGPARAEVSSWLMNLLPYGLLQDRVDVILRDGAKLWLGGQIQNDFRTGLTAFYPESNRFDYLESGLTADFPASDVYCLAADSARVYIGTPHGLYQVGKSDHIAQGPLNARRGLLDDFVVSLALRNDSLLIGTAGGLTLLNVETDSLFHIRPETFHQQIIYDLELVDNTVWIASSAGAFRYTLDTDRLQQFQDPELVLFSSVLNIERQDQVIWLAADAGVVELDLTTGKSKSFREASGWRDRRALAVNDRLVALAGDRGITFIIPGAKKTRTVQITSQDGLASDDVSSLMFEGDYLWVGTDHGLTRFLWNQPRWVD